jgi:hypothetical protein
MGRMRRTWAWQTCSLHPCRVAREPSAPVEIRKKATYFKSLAQLLHKLLKKSASLVFVLDLQAKIP